MTDRQAAALGLHQITGWLRHPKTSKAWTTRKSKECYQTIKVCCVYAGAAPWTRVVETHNGTHLEDTMFVIWVEADCPQEVLDNFERRLSRNFVNVVLTSPNPV